MSQHEAGPTRLAQVQARLALVYDPELDQPITELGFIGGLSLEGSAVTVAFRLPTFFCAANFAFLMAADIRDRVLELPWVSEVKVTLVDHFVSEEVTEGVNCNNSFTETFANLAEGELDDLRALFRRKAFVARQERLLRRLFALGLSDEGIVELTLGELAARLIAEGDPEADSHLERYLAIRLERGLSGDPQHPAFTEPDDSRIEPGQFREYLRAARSVRLNMEFNTSLCRGLLQTRYSLSESQPA